MRCGMAFASSAKVSKRRVAHACVVDGVSWRTSALGWSRGQYTGYRSCFGPRGGVSLIHSSRIVQSCSLICSKLTVLCSSGTDSAANRRMIISMVPRFQLFFFLMSPRTVLALVWFGLYMHPTKFATVVRSTVTVLLPEVHSSAGVLWWTIVSVS